MTTTQKIKTLHQTAVVLADLAATVEDIDGTLARKIADLKADARRLSMALARAAS